MPHSWFPEDLRGLRVLGLASGGGQQMPILTARGARCTVLDYTPAQLDADRTVAEREGYDIDLVRADMSKPLPFADASFDLYEDTNGYGRLHELGIPSFWATLAQKPED
ncbi:class I SAM-dependent methyltransferase [Bifidobacterium pullorum]|uniref:class I SAM-dependent methyltransferase n=1 Tax=Bifidobacterium pullorum TaxID=78448 RepID=UPI0032083E0C